MSQQCHNHCYLLIIGIRSNDQSASNVGWHVTKPAVDDVDDIDGSIWKTRFLLQLPRFLLIDLFRKKPQMNGLASLLNVIVRRCRFETHVIDVYENRTSKLTSASMTFKWRQCEHCQWCQRHFEWCKSRLSKMTVVWTNLMPS